MILYLMPSINGMELRYVLDNGEIYTIVYRDDKVKFKQINNDFESVKRDFESIMVIL